MKNRKLEIVLELLLIKEKYSEKEIKDALEFLNKHRNIKDILNYFENKPKLESKEINSLKKKGIKEQRSKAVIDIENVDKDKFQLLSEFDSALREGKYLPNTGNLREVGLQISKDFSSKNDRRSLISKLLSVLVKLNIEEIKSVIERVKSVSYSSESDYKQLSDFIIKGAKEKNENTN